MNDLDRLLDKLFEDPAFARVYREERITWELQARAVCRYLRGEVERLERELYRAYKRQAMSNNPFPVPIPAEEVQRQIDELRGEYNYPGEVTDE